jgi:hypothetical protein
MRTIAGEGKHQPAAAASFSSGVSISQYKNGGFFKQHERRQSAFSGLQTVSRETLKPS